VNHAVKALARVLRLTLSVSDLASLRFAFSPRWEIIASLRVLKAPAAHVLHLSWAKLAREAIDQASVDLELLYALVPVPTRVLPAFLAPTPTTPIPDIAAEIETVVEVSHSALRSELEHVFGSHLTGPLADLHRDPGTQLPRLADQMRAYWDLALAGSWPRIRGVLEGDVMYRGRRLAEGGPRLLFADLDPTITWAEGSVQIDHPTVTADHALGGRGLVLVPSAFVWPRVFVKVDDRWPPVVRYPARGVATLWERGRQEAEHPLASVMGRSRAILLSELEAPATTTELAARIGLSPAAVSQHLSRLRAAGLVTSHRTGHVVLYARTDRAQFLLDLP